MGNYISQTDIENRIGLQLLKEMTDDAGQTVDVAKMNQAISEAEGDADSYIANKYTIPLATVPEVVKGKVLDLVIYNLYKKNGPPEEISQDKKDAVTWFKDLAKGVVTLGLPTPPAQTATEGGPKSTTTASDKAFSGPAWDRF